MTKNILFETDYERFLRERAESIQSEYLRCSREILNGEITPNRVIQHLSKRFNLSGEGVKKILKRKGIYVSAKQPVIRPKIESKQLSVFATDQVSLARV